MSDLSVQRATIADLDALVPLFDGYRVFYAQPSDHALAGRFLSERLRRDECVVFLARADDTGTGLGFTQLYPMFSSVRAARTWILNDLFVAPSARQRGVARALLDAAAAFARTDGAIRLELETTPDNIDAQRLYRAHGWLPNDDTLRFQLPLTG